MPTIPLDLNRTAAEYLSNSARWFPNLHNEDPTPRRLLAECFEFALAEQIDLAAEMAVKVAVCETRWGGPRG